MQQQRYAGIYTRISRDRVGAGLGVDRQRADCEQLAETLGWSVVTVHSDNDLSAYSGKPRPGYQALLDDIRSSKVTAVIAWHTDRLHRSPVELETYISVCEEHAVPTHCARAGIVDLTTAAGRMAARIAGAIARGESEHMSERVRRQKLQAAMAGQRLGGPRRFGYTADGMGLVPAEADRIRDAVRDIVAGDSVHSITKKWRAQVPTVRGGEWIPANVSRLLTRPQLAGIATHNGEVVGAGRWPAIISEDEHLAVRHLLTDPKRNTYTGVRSLKWIGSGLYRCGRCGSDLRPATAVNRDGSKRRVYRCRASNHLKINGPEVDDHVIAAALVSLISREVVVPPVDDNNTAVLDALHSEANALRVRLVELDDMFTDGEIDRAGRARQRERINTRLTEITSRLERATVNPLDGLEHAPSPTDWFEGLPVTRQRSIVDFLMRVTILPSRAGRPRKDAGPNTNRIQIDWKHADPHDDERS